MNVELRSIESIRRFYAAGPSLDDAGRVPFATPDIVWHVPGHNRVSGDYHGTTAVFVEMRRRMQPLDEWGIDVRQVMANRDLVMAVVELRARRGSHSVITAGGHVFRMDAAGRVAEAWGFVDDQDALDALFDS